MFNSIQIEDEQSNSTSTMYYLKKHEKFFREFESDVETLSSNEKQKCMKEAGGFEKNEEPLVFFVNEQYMDVVKANLSAILLSQPKNIEDLPSPLFYQISDYYFTPQGNMCAVIVNYDEIIQDYLLKNHPEKKENIDYFINEIKNYAEEMSVENTPKKAKM